MANQTLRSIIWILLFLLLATLTQNLSIMNSISNLEIESCNVTSCSSCQVCMNGKCQTQNDSCYIGTTCYQTNSTYSNNNKSCLYCQPSTHSDQWSFNPLCSAESRCFEGNYTLAHMCDRLISQQFYMNYEKAVIDLYNFAECGKSAEACQAGFFSDKTTGKHFACCPGYFCPEGQLCMIPCRIGSYCPTPLNAVNGICQSPIKCPNYSPKPFDVYGCGGSSVEGFCPTGSYCPLANLSLPCPNHTSYCPTGSAQHMTCPSHFDCELGRVRRRNLGGKVSISVVFIIIGFVLGIELLEWLKLEKKVIGQYKLEEGSKVSSYFKPPSKTRSKSTFQLNIHLHKARLRNVTKFDQKRNEGFTGRITAGRLTALMGGSGCGKSSLLETIHGRRRLLPNGYITFGQHEPLSNILTDYVGYVPQADIMHEDLTVFEIVYYSARTRRLNEPKKIIKNDVCFVLEKLNLGHLHNSKARTLSGGT